MRLPSSRPFPRSSLRWLMLALAAVACAARPTHAQTGGDEATEETPPTPTSSANQTDLTFEWSGKMAKGSRLEIRGVAGGITIKPAKGGTTRVTATKSGPDASKLDIEVKTGPRGVQIVTKHKRRLNEARADFTVFLASGVALEAHTVSGDIEASGLQGPVVLETVSGSIDVSARGRLSAKAVSGKVQARLSEPLADSSLETVNGAVELTLPKGANARVDAAVVNGRIESDFPLSRSSGVVGTEVSGVLGKGGPSIALQSVNGRIEIRKHG